MTFQLTQEEGEYLVKLARRAVEEHLKTGDPVSIPKGISPKFQRNCGVFVTINARKGEEKDLRGCIGYPYPTTPLAQAVVESAIQSATQDPRFYPVSIKELDNVVFEISVLTPPEQVTVTDTRKYPLKIKIGKDGLIMENGLYKGLLLPQVPVEWGWNEEEFLSQCCIKAGLPPDSWLVEDTKVYKFQAIIFEEETPRGKIRRKTLRGQ